VRLPFPLPSQKNFDAVGFGLNAVDHLIVVPEYPAFDTKVRFTDYQKSAGGQTATAMVALQRLGLKTAYAGRFGSDDAGTFGRAELEREDVNLDFAETIQNAANQVAFIVIDQRSGERTIVWDRDDRLSYAPDEAPVEIAAQGRVLHIDAHDPPACSVMAKSAHAAGAIVTSDIDNIYEGLTDLLPLIDVLITSAGISASIDRHRRCARFADRNKGPLRMSNRGRHAGRARRPDLRRRTIYRISGLSMSPAAAATRPAPAMLFMRDLFSGCFVAKNWKRA
jgi:sugar/nucleoside kinase (ribokinase family)